jgi:uncharacterized membrane protein YeaQ/YmgE (transglycosylase-associated protein family)
MLWNLVVFALIGLFCGGAARLFYSNRVTRNILGTLLLGTVGGVLGGLSTWLIWPAVAEDMHSWALLLSFAAALFVLVLWPALVYARNSRPSV